MKVLDLFSGLGGATKAFVERGHSVDTLDYEAKFKPTFFVDIREFHPSVDRYDFVWASPDCRRFSVAALAKHWTKRGEVHYADTPEAQEAVELVQAALRVIQEAAPRYWIMENPVGKLRSLGVLKPYRRRTITYCKFGARWRKGTDLWGRFPPGLALPRPCRNGDSCHEAAPAGTKNGGIQGVRNPAVRAEVPYGLSLAVCQAVEDALVSPAAVTFPRWAQCPPEPLFGNGKL